MWAGINIVLVGIFTYQYSNNLFQRPIFSDRVMLVRFDTHTSERHRQNIIVLSYQALTIGSVIRKEPYHPQMLFEMLTNTTVTVGDIGQSFGSPVVAHCCTGYLKVKFVCVCMYSCKYQMVGKSYYQKTFVIIS